MSENYLTEDQRTEAWHQARSGKFTGSRFIDMQKRKPSTEFNDQPKAYKDLIYQVVLERLTGTYNDTGMDSASLRWGREHEKDAQMYYMLCKDEEVNEVGFLLHKDLSFVGISPDGVIKPSGGLEIKCPKNPYVQMQRFVHGIDEEHKPQVYGGIWVGQTDWWDFASYDPRMPPHMKLFVQRVYRDEVYIKQLEESALRAESDVRQLLDKFSIEGIEEAMQKFNIRKV